MLNIPPPEALSRAADALGTTHARRAAEKMTRVALVGGCLMVTGSTGNVYTVALDGSSCNCPAFGECWHRACVDVLELANRPAGMTLPPLQESLARADAALVLDTMPNLTTKRERAERALELVNDLF